MATLDQVLTERRDEILARFLAEAGRKDLSPPGLSRANLVDHIPTFLAEMAAEIAHSGELRVSQDVTDTSAAARQHGGQRWSLGYDLEALVREYGVLRHCILDVLKRSGAELSIDDFDTFAKCFNVGVAEAVAAYTRYRDEQVAAQQADLEFLTQAGQILASSLDYRTTLTRLTRMIVPQLADWCAVHLDDWPAKDMPVVHVDAEKAEILRDLFARFAFAEHAGYGYAEVRRSGQTLSRELGAGAFDATATTPEHRALLRAIQPSAWIIVPLRVQESTFGAIALGQSVPGRRFRPNDARLVEDLARRAAIAIDNARLYELSQVARARVESDVRAKDEFVAMVSHELRTPLNAILGWVRLLRAGAVSGERREHALAVIERNAESQNRLIADLLDISRAIAGKVQIEPTQIDLCNTVEIVVESARPAAEAKRIQIDTDLHRERATVWADPERLQQIVGNLLANAVKFSVEGGHVRVSVRREGSHFELTVADDGIGIAPEFLPHVFEIFRQSSRGSTRSHGGLGLGLAVAKHLADLHSGTLEAQSEGPGHGARFILRLPIPDGAATASSATPAPPATSAGGVPAGAALWLQGLHALVVDDDDGARELFRAVLEAAGMQTRTAAGVDEALAILESFEADVIVSDVGMPDRDGYALIRAIRSSAVPGKSQVPAVAVTAYTRAEDRTRALIDGFNAHLAKPVKPEELVATVADVTGRARSAAR